ncbi:MAG: alpha/beta fold hydrolase [Syntrophomonas sp.]|nr:alpha/beta fold hydrolase [Syntrophomonas sp.]
MKKNLLLVGSADEIGAKLQENYDQMLDSTRKWAEILSFDPAPQTGMSPKDVVWTKNKTKLYRYVSPNGYKYRTPVLMVYALINKAYILDLTPGMSLVEYLNNAGFDVYLLDWGDFEWEDRNLNFGNFVFDYIARAVRKVCQISNCNELSILGYCMGGTMTAMYAPLFPQPIIKNFIALAAPFDFSNAGTQSIWMKAPGFSADRITDTFDLIPKDFIQTGVMMLRPVNNFLGTYSRLWKSIDNGASVLAWKALDKWVNDNINFPGEAYRQWVKELYQENKLTKNEFVIKGMTIDLAKIKSNLLVMAGEKDHLVLPHQSEAIMNLVSSEDKTYREHPVGHGGLVFGNYALNKSYPFIADWLAARS